MQAAQNDRMQQLQRMLEKSPTDPFLLYGIAMEHKKAGDAARADLLSRAESLAMSDLPWIPVMHTRSKALISPRLHGYVPNLRNAAPTRFLRLVG